MKKIFATYLLYLATTSSLIAQDKMVVDKLFPGETYYGGFSTPLKSISELPSNIQLNIRGLINNLFGILNDNITFSSGQIVDLKRYFYADTTIYRRHGIIPKYDLNFILKDTTIGLKSYCINLNLDEYGQIVYVNWPKENYSDKTAFISRKNIEQFALREAQLKGFITKDYRVDVIYNDKFDKLCWVFKFPVKIEKNRQRYNAFEVDFKEMTIIDEYELLTTIDF